MQHEDDLSLVKRSRHWLDDFTRRQLDPALRQYGFSRRGRNWNRRTDDLVHVLHIQAGRFGPGVVNLLRNLSPTTCASCMLHSDSGAQDYGSSK